MKVELRPDYPIDDASCKEHTGRSLQDWFGEIEARGFAEKRREAIRMIYDESPNRSGDIWWPTTIWVEYERSKGVVNKDGLADGYHICSTKTIAAPVDKVYSALTDPAQMKAWFGAGYKGKVEPGATFEDGDGNTGAYLRVRENKDVRFTWKTPGSSETSVDIAVSDKGGGKTYLQLDHKRIQDRPEADGLRRAWGEAFSKLKSILES